MEVLFTLYVSLFNLDRALAKRMTWDAFVLDFSKHLRVQNKFDAACFGPYVLTPPDRKCHKHKDGVPREGPHRCDECVQALTLAVFDVDTATPEQIRACNESLSSAGLARLWYSSFSYRPGMEHPSLRLVLPLSKPVPVESWASFRRNLVLRHQIPANLVQCSGVSHAYFVPSCPPEGTPYFESTNGSPVDVASIPHAPELRIRPPAHVMDSWQPPAEPADDAALDLTPYLERVKQRRRVLAHRTDPKAREKGELLQRLLNGEPLAEHGRRNDSTTKVAGMLAYTLSDAPVSALLALMRPSLNAMVAAGSKLTEDAVERMLLSAMRRKAETDAVDAEIQRLLSASLEKVCRSYSSPATGVGRAT